MRRAAVLAILLAGLALLVATPAGASHSQWTMMEDTTQLLGPDTAARDATLDAFKALGTDVVKVRVQWRDVAPDPASNTKPDFDASDPGSYPAGAWDALDGAVQGIVSRGMRPFLMVGPPAPDWATGGPTKKYIGVWKVDPAAFGDFVRAIARRYSGTFAGLPRVTMWSIWNEPNHPQFIQPLSEKIGGRWVPSAPSQYRRLYVSATDALAATGHSADTILFGEVLPIGNARLSTLGTMKPILWLREFFCVDKNYRPYRGRAASVRGCNPFPRLVTSGFAIHPYTRPVGPRFHLPSPDDATIGQIGRVEKALNLIAKTHRVRRNLPIYSTEFGIQSNPPDCIGFGAPLAKQAEILNEAEYDSYIHGRVKTYSQYLLIDDPILTQFAPGTNARYGRYQTGLEWGENAVRCESPAVHLAYGTPKEPTYDAFQTPIYVRMLSFGRGVQVFGRARPRGHEQQAIEVLHNGHEVANVLAKGYFLISLSGSSAGKWQLSWTYNGQTYESRVATALPDPGPSAY